MQRQSGAFTTEFKLPMVQLAVSGKPRTEIVREYDLTASALDNWIKKY